MGLSTDPFGGRRSVFGITDSTSVWDGLAAPGVCGGSVASPAGRSSALGLEVWLSALKRAHLVPSLQQDMCSRIWNSLLRFPTTNGLFLLLPLAYVFQS